jgi:hypothetical protein
MMRMTACGVALLWVAAFAGAARAETTGQFTYQVPSGWEACKGLDGFEANFCNPKGALIAIKSPFPGADAAAIARVGLQGNEVLQDLALPFGGQPGHMVVTRFVKDGQMLLVAAAGTAAGGGTKAVLLAEPAVAQESVSSWISLVNGGSFGDPSAPPRPTHTFTIRNLGPSCEAIVTIDGQRIAVPAGQSRELQIPEGQHEFQWKDNSGRDNGATASVPPAETLNAGCQPAAAPNPPANPPPTEPPPTGGGDPEFGPVADGARAAINFYRLSWNLVFQKDLLPEAHNVDRMMLKVVIRRPRGRWADFLAYPQHLAVLQQAMDRTKDNPTARAELRRLAYYALYRAGQALLMKQCAPTGELNAGALDCAADGWVKLADTQEAGMEVLSMMSTKFANIGSADDPKEIVDAMDKVGR